MTNPSDSWQKQFCMFSALILSLLAQNCAQKSPTNPDKEILVIQAYLYANAPVSGIQISTAQNYAGNFSLSQLIAGAEITLSKNGRNWKLAFDPNQSNYYYPGNDLAIVPGDTFELTVRYREQIAFAKTVVPPAVTGLVMEQDTLHYTEAFHQSASTVEPAVLHWNRNQDGYNQYYCIIENMEKQPRLIDSLYYYKSPYYSESRAEPSIKLDFTRLNFRGWHRLRVYAAEPGLFYIQENSQQDTRNIHATFNNIKNGVGIFTALSGDTTWFYLF
jgi:hypothetical protein